MIQYTVSQDIFDYIEKEAKNTWAVKNSWGTKYSTGCTDMSKLALMTAGFIGEFYVAKYLNILPNFATSDVGGDGGWDLDFKGLKIDVKTAFFKYPQYCLHKHINSNGSHKGFPADLYACGYISGWRQTQPEFGKRIDLVWNEEMKYNFIGFMGDDMIRRMPDRKGANGATHINKMILWNHCKLT